MSQLHWEAVTPLLRSALIHLMAEQVFGPFRLVGGTALSLQLGHRLSIDIDLFTDARYGSVNFGEIDEYIRNRFAYVSPSKLPEIVGMGMSYIAGTDPESAFKLDLYYTDDFFEPDLKIGGIRMATPAEIAAMKIDVVQRGGRKKDFWDLHELRSKYSLKEMIGLHRLRYPWTHDEAAITRNLTDFANADGDFDPVCLKQKSWGLIKLDLAEDAEDLDRLS